jgi:catechol 2,3-dioxygenase-like lactoylglutathione lyase family enzyme
MPFQGIDHLAFPSFDAEKTLRFQTEVLLAELEFAMEGVSRGWGGRRYLMTGFRLGEVRLHFFQLDPMARPAADDLPQDTRHVAFRVSSAAEVDALEQRLVERGIPYWEEEHYGSRSIYVTDPNGIVFEATPAVAMPASVGPDPAARDRIRRWSAP